MDITEFIASLRNNVLLLGDYGSYRTRLSRRLLTVRRKLGRTSAKGKKYIGRDPITATDIGSNHEFAQLLLLSSERAWAHAMHMKTARSTGTSTQGIAASARKHIISRLTKAHSLAKELLGALSDQGSSGSSEVDVLEARAYAASIEGSRQFERQRWTECLVAYSEARVIYAALLSCDKKEAFKDTLASVVDPSLRYAAYKSQIPRSRPVAAIARNYFPRSDADLVLLITKKDAELLRDEPASSTASSIREQDRVPKTITWRTRTVPLEDAAISIALASVEAASIKLSTALSSDARTIPRKDKAAAYDEVLIASQDAVDATKHAIDELVSEGVGQSDQRMQALQVTRTAVNYALVGWRIGRNRILAGPQDGALVETGNARKAARKSGSDGKDRMEQTEGTGRQLARYRERVVLYDGILQSIDSVSELPGVPADQPFMNELQAKRSYFQALKCLSLARSHSLLSAPENALALLLRALDLSKTSLSQLSTPLESVSPTTSPPTLVIHPTTAQSLNSLLQTALTRQHALVDFLKHISASTPPTAATTHKPLIQSLDHYPPGSSIDLTNLVAYPPSLEPIPIKPIFLDVAWNYIDYPGRRQQTPPPPTPAPKRPAAAHPAPTSDQKKEEASGRRGWFSFGRG